MTPEENLKYLHRIFTKVRQLDDDDGLGVWPQKDGTILCGIWINDTFSWACAETEDITPENLAEFERACDEVYAVSPQRQRRFGIEEARSGDMNFNLLHDAAVLFASRNRKMLPFKSNGEYPVHATVVSLLEKIGAPDSDCDKIWKDMGLLK